LAAQALAIAWAANAPGQAWFAAMRMAHNAVHDGQVQVQAKIFYAKLAVNAAQAMRGGTLDLPTQRQQSFMSDKREDFVELADNLLDQRRLPEAEQLLAMAREDDYHQLVRSTEPRRQRLAFSGPEQAVAQVLAVRRQTLEHAAADWTRQLRPLGAAEQPVQQALEATVDALLAAQTLPSAPLLPEPVRPAPAGGPSPTPHIYYLPTPERLRIAVVRAGATEVVDVPVTEAALLRHIADLRQVLQNPATDARPQAQAMHALLWAPIAHLLPTDADSTVVLHPEGALRYLPFATLFDGTHWLVERHTLALNAGGGAPGHATPRTGWALFGSSRGAAGLPALAQVPGELAAIRRARPAATTALDAAFTAPRLQAALAQRSVVHIASHFVLAPGDSRASTLQLGGGQRVSLAALAGDAYRFDGLDLLTLSACDTAVPLGVDAQGRSLDSLAWLAHARGAKNVLASLWPVPDASTAALMGRFYQHLAAGQGKAEALRTAQLALLAQPGADAQTARGLQPARQGAQSTVRHPYYWGAFVLLSNK
jgi:CHAT domain-containing protein